MKLQFAGATSLALLAPALLVLMLVGESLPGLAKVVDPPLLALDLLFGGALFVLFLLRTSPWLEVGKDTRFGASAVAGSLGLYVLGSFEGSAVLRLFSILLAYPSLVLLLGGRRLAVSTLPSALVLGFLPLAGGGASVGLAVITAGYLAGTAVACLLLFRLVRNRDVPEDCERCGPYRQEGRGFCLYCGKLLTRFTDGLHARRLVALAALTIALALSFQVSMSALSFGPAGLQRFDYGLAGAQAPRTAVLPQGWNVSSQEPYASAFGQGFAYALSGPTSVPVDVRIGVAASQGYAQSVALQGLNGVAVGYVGTPVGPLVLYNLTGVGGSFNGVLYSTTATYESNGVFTTNNVVYFVGGSPADVTVNKTSGVDEVLSALANSTTYSPASQFFTSVVASPVLKYPIAAGVTASAYGIGLVAVAAMAVSVESASRYENSMGLTEKEFEMFALLPRSGTGRDALERLQGAGHSVTWPETQGFLFRLEALKLVEARARGGNPAMVWSKRGA